MSDTELVDFVEKNGIQIWPERKSKHGPVARWWVQNPTPWLQTYSISLRHALMRLAERLQADA